MKTIITSRFGKVEFNQEDLINFAKGIPGFEQETQFIIIRDEKDHPFVHLQSTQTSALAFIIINPFEVFQVYEFDLGAQNKEELEIEDTSEIVVYVILSIPEDFTKTTVNLKAPLIINWKKQKGKQIILHDSDYLTKTPLFSKRVKKGGE